MLPLLAILSLIIYALLIYFTLRSSPEQAWQQLEVSHKRRGLLSKRPDDWENIHRQNQIARTIAITMGYVAAILWTNHILV